ncbi:hypothetical protein RUND412_009645 [Rhizina undulata]
MTTFTSIPVLDFSLSQSPETKDAFLSQLKSALLEVGFLYISNTGISDELVDNVSRLGKSFFDLPNEEKLRVEMKNSPHFLGYSRLGNEITKHAIDWREQIDLATELPAPAANEPRYRQLRGPNQWPQEELIPGFQETFTTFIDQMTDLSTEFTRLMAEAIGLPRNSFDRFFNGIGESASGTVRQDKLKIVKYPDLGELGENGNSAQGDSMLSSYLLQVTDHLGLQVQNSAGEWINCPPIPGTFVVAIGQGLEAMTSGVCVSTTHRVLSPPAGTGARISIPFFQGVSYDATFESMDVPTHILELKNSLRQRQGDHIDSVEMTFKKEQFNRLGEATLMNRVKSHPDVGEKYYPDLLAIIREQQKFELEKQNEKEDEKDAGALLVPNKAGEQVVKGRKRAPTIVLEKIDNGPSYGEDPGPEGSLERRAAFEARKADALPDEIRVVGN